MTSLCFDTILVTNHSYGDNLSQLFHTFVPHDIKNFIFISEFDFKLHTLSLKNEKIKTFEKNIKNSSPRGISCKLYHNLILDENATFNKDIHRLIAVRKNGTLFVTLPFLNSENYSIFAHDINRLLYNPKIFPVFLDFDKFMSFSDKEISDKLLKNQNAVFTFDINYLFAPENRDVIEMILSSQSLIVPTVSNHISKYVATEENLNFFINNIGKKNYSSFSSLIRKTLSELF